MMKKPLVLFLVLVFFTIIFSGCSSESNTDDTAADTSRSANVLEVKKIPKVQSTEENGLTAETTAPNQPAPAVIVEECTDITEEIDSRYNYEIRVIRCNNNGKTIYGKAFLPVTEDNVPLVIFSHGFGTNHEVGESYAEVFAASGIAFYTFDFCGGSDNETENLSDGSITEMSVMTEVSDLEAVLDMALRWDFIDHNEIFLCGGSQGGLVSFITGVRRSADVAGLVLFYPDFEVYDHIHEMFDSKEIPDIFVIDGITVGRIFAKDIWDYDARKDLSAFHKPVLLMHGTEDDNVSPQSSYRANELLPNCKFYLIEGADHGFSDEYADIAASYALDFVSENRAVS